MAGLRNCIGSERERLRAVGAVFLLVAHLLSSSLHGTCSLIIHGCAPRASCAMSDHSKASDAGLPVHHCHGCFVLSVPAPPVGTAEVEYAVSVSPWSPMSTDGLAPTPPRRPPKSLI